MSNKLQNSRNNRAQIYCQLLKIFKIFKKVCLFYEGYITLVEKMADYIYYKQIATF